MSIAPVSGTNFFLTTNTQTTQTKLQQLQSEFQQLGQDLQAGNVSQAQQDFAALQQNLPGAQAPASSTTGTLAQAFQALGQDLQSGNLSAAQQDFATIQQDAQQGAAGGARGHHHRHHHVESQDSSQSNTNSAISQAFGTLGQALQAGNLSQAQQAYTTIQQDLANYLPGALSNLSASTPETLTATSTSSSISITA